ncbi:hypothetical protein [Pseudomonas caricapapayae]|uniref:hypothetical protein n=1 Tax=Pseudomonas caricapapayae TaxID=46678 RepID=UPI0011C46394|nr:hypothetical protein [Pseudomonas caricapapayae]
MHPEQKRLIKLIDKASSQLKQFEYAQSVVPTAKFQSRISGLEDKLWKYRHELNNLPVPLSQVIREMVMTISEFHRHEMVEKTTGFFVYAGGKILKISKCGFIRHWFNVKPFNGFDDYEYWIEKIRTEGKGTPVANHAAYHVYKINGLKRKLEAIDLI